MKLEWSARNEPLQPQAVVATGPAASKLARRLLQAPHLPVLDWAASSGLIVLLGETANLPWVDGVRYLGRDPAEPRLYLPTSLEPSLPPEWIASALVRQFGLAAPLALTESLVVIPLHQARALHATALEQWLRGGEPQ